MDSIYASIDLGTDSIKMVVVQKVKDEFYILATAKEESKGIKNGQIEDTKQAVQVVKKLVKKISGMIGLKITKVLACIPPTDSKMDIVVGSVDLEDYNEVSGQDVSRVLKDALVGQLRDDYELVTAIPISFKLDDLENIKDPKGMKGETLEVKMVISTTPKEPLYRILEVLKLSGLETVDIAYTSTGDYYEVKNERLEKSVGAIINIGANTTNVSIFNKGIQIKNEVLSIGSHHVDHDISYIFKTNKEDSISLKEEFAVSMASYADSNDRVECVVQDGEKKEISQVGISKVVEARLEEILNLAKNKIKTLTKREIRYIIITGGLSELAGFQYIVEEIFGIKAKVCNITTMGGRHNKYSSALGVCKYFDEKLALRGKEYSMLKEEDLRNLISTQQNRANNNIVSKVFGHFFDN